METEIKFTKDIVFIRTPVSVPMVGETMHEEKLTYDKLPVNGMTMTVTGIDMKRDEVGKISELIFKVSNFHLLLLKTESTEDAKLPKQFDIILTPSSIKNKLIPLRKEIKPYFPGAKLYLKFKTNVDEVEVKSRVGGAYKHVPVGDPFGGQYILGGLSKWFEHNNLKEGDKITVKVIEPGKKYRLIAPKEH